MNNIVSNIICKEYMNGFKWSGGPYNKNAMVIDFRLRGDPNDDATVLQVLIWGQDNYVGVWARVIKLKEVISSLNLEIEPFWLYSFHDSCWQSDGVQSIINTFRDMISSIDTLGKDNWYSQVILDDEQERYLLDTVRQRDNQGKPPKPKALQNAIDLANKAVH